nr:Chain C, Vaccinia derived octamer peptide [Vaccinia virus]3TIE_F Chain F, Vaccinia derived octamer peptide [Vaccinia virus]
AIVNYANL